jgi:plasmid stability protein
MASVMIDDLDEASYARLRARAVANRRSPEAEAREVLANELSAGVEADSGDWVADLEKWHGEMVTKYGILPDSTPLIRQMRDEE